MPLCFKVWNQANDNTTMAVRVSNVREVRHLSQVCAGPDMQGTWRNLAEYLAAARVAVGAPPVPYTRPVDVIWLSRLGYGTPRLFPGRRLVATYTGPQRLHGGYATQCYCVIDPAGYGALGAHHRAALSVEYIAHSSHDVLVVLP